MASRRKPRRPQWKSPSRMRKNSRPIKLSTGIAEIAVQGRHRAGRDAALEAVAHDEVGAGAQLVDERHRGGEVVAVVGVAHDDVAARARPRCPPSSAAP